MSLFGKDDSNGIEDMKEIPISKDAGTTSVSQKGRHKVSLASDTPHPNGEIAKIGKSISIKGELGGNENLIIEGTVEGAINLPNNELTVGAHGTVRADVHAKSLIVIGKITGNASAGERLEIQASGCVEGDVRGPRLVIQEGARLNGSVEMAESKGTAKREVSPIVAEANVAS